MATQLQPFLSGYRPDQGFNNTITWDQFKNSQDWKEVTTQLQNRIDHWFFTPISFLYKRHCIDKSDFVHYHTFPINNMCWSLLDLFTQLVHTEDWVRGYRVDLFLRSNKRFFSGLIPAINLANTYENPLFQSKQLSLFDIFRNKPIHNNLINWLGSLDVKESKCFTIKQGNFILAGTPQTKDYIEENPIILIESIQNYFKEYLSKLKSTFFLQEVFKKRIRLLFGFSFSYV